LVISGIGFVVARSTVRGRPDRIEGTAPAAEFDLSEDDSERSKT
jgi:hypothetical protein